MVLGQRMVLVQRMVQGQRMVRGQGMVGGQRTQGGGPGHGGLFAQSDRSVARHPDRLAGGEFDSVDEGAVGGVEVFDGEPIALAGEQAVTGRNGGLGDDEVALVVASDDPGGFRIGFV